MSSVQQKMTSYTKETGNYGPLKGKNSTETIPEKDIIADILDKHFNTTVFKKLKEYMENIKNMICKQKVNINKRDGRLKSEPKRNSEALK